MIKKYGNFLGGLNLEDASDIKENELQVLKNMYINEQNQLQTRRGYRKFADQIGSSPITSIFYRETDELARHCICFAGGNRYYYDENTNTRQTAASGLTEYEPFTGRTSNRVRADFAVYKGVAYIGDGVNPYSQSSGTTVSFIDATGPNTCTFDNATDKVSDVAHGLVDGDEIYFTNSGGALPTGITALKVYYVVSAATDDFKISLTDGGTAVNFTTNGTGTSSRRKLLQPRVRYVQYMEDRVYAGGAENAPSTIYYTDKLDTDGTDINNNSVVIGGDEQGRITGMHDFVQSVLVFKDRKIYVLSVGTDVTVETVDAQGGGHCERAIQSMNNSLVYFSDRGVDVLVRRTGVTGTGSVDSLPLSSKINKLFRQIAERQYGAGAGRYIQELNNYYFAFDTNDDNVPDKLVVYNSKLGAWSEYTYPPLYDFGRYKTSAGEYKHLFTSGSGGQVYQMEYGYDDDGQKIESELRTKDDDLGDGMSQKVFSYLDVSGYKQEGENIDISVFVDGETVGFGQITDAQLNFGQPAGTIGVNPIGTYSIGVAEGDANEGLPIYEFAVRIPFYARGIAVSVGMQATGQRILSSLKIQANEEVRDLFPYNNIL